MTASFPKQDQNTQEAKKKAIIIGQCKTCANFQSSTRSSSSTLVKNDMNGIWLRICLLLQTIVVEMSVENDIFLTSCVFLSHL